MADRLDTRDLIERMDEIDNDSDLPEVGTEEYYQESMKEKNEIKELLKELQENCDEEPQYGIQLIPKDDFVDYAQEFAEDVGYMNMSAHTHTGYSPNPNERIVDMWPFKHIDWEAAAEELAQDYIEVEFRGVAYYAR